MKIFFVFVFVLGMAFNLPGQECTLVGITFDVTESSGIADDDGILCVGEEVGITVNGGTDIIWSPGGETTEMITASSDIAEEVTFTVTIMDAEQCTKDTSITITWEAGPDVNIELLEGGELNEDLQVCISSDVLLRASSMADPPPAFSWTGGPTEADFPLGDMLVEGDNTFILEAIGSNSCPTTLETTIRVSPLIVPAISVVEASGLTSNDGIICAGTAVALTASGGDTFLWNTEETSEEIMSEELNVNSVFSVAVSQTDNACPAETAMVTVTVNQLPEEAEIIIMEESGNTDNDGIVCFEDLAILTANGGVNYEWSTGASTPTITPLISSNSTTFVVTVTDSNGCAAEAMTTITGRANPNAVITIAETSGNENDGVICAGEPVTLSGAGGMSYSWSNGETVSQISPDDLITGDNLFTVTVTDGNGCTDIAQEIITVESSLTAMVQVVEDSGNNGNDETICLGDNVSLVASGGQNFSWEVISGGATISSDNSATVMPLGLTEGSNRFRVTVSNEGSQCPAVESVTVTALATPEPSIQVFDNSGSSQNDGEICFAESVTLTASGGNAYSWSNGGGSESITISNLPVGTETFTVTVTDLDGCFDIASELITVNSLPAVNLTTPDNTVCVGEQATLNATPGFVSYNWSVTNSSNAMTSFIVNTATSQSYSVTVEDNNRCENQAQITITGLETPTANIISNNAPTFEICQGEEVTLTATGGTIYNWGQGPTENPDLLLNGATVGSDSYTVTVTGANGCEATDQETVTVNALPVPTLMVNESSGTSPNDQFVCLMDQVTLIASGGVTYDFGAGASANNQAIFTLANLNANPFSVTVTNDNGCRASETVIITGLALPVATIDNEEISTTNPGDQTICEEESINLIASGGLTYEWSTGQFGQTLILDDVSISDAQTYLVTATNAQGCTDEASIQVGVLPLPRPQITFDEDSGISDNGEVCPNTELSLRVSGGDTFEWSTNETQPEISVPTNNPGDFTYSVMAFQEGCENVASALVEVFDPPRAVVGQISGNRVVSFDLTVPNESIRGDADITSNLWTFGEPGDAFPPSLSTQNSEVIPMFSYATPGQKEVTLKVTDQNTCMSSDTRSFSVSENTSCQITGGFDNRTVCVNTPFTIDLAVQLSGTMVTQWNWNIPNGVTFDANESNSGSRTFSIDTPIGNNTDFTFSVSFTDDASPMPCTSETVSFIVSVEPSPPVQLSLQDDTPICPNGIATLRVDGLGDELYIIETEDEQIFSVLDEGNIRYRLGDQAGTSTAVINKITNPVTGCVETRPFGGSPDFGTIQIDVPAAPSVIIDGSYVAPCPGGDLTLSVINSGNLSDFTWTFDENELPGNQETIVIPEVDVGGIVTVSATDSNGCVGMSSEDVELSIRPELPSISGLETVCNGQQNVEYVTTEIPLAEYNWTITGGGQIIDQRDNTLLVDWTDAAGTGEVSVVIEATPTIDGDGCESEAGSLPVTIDMNQSPDTTEVLLISQGEAVQEDFFLIAVSESTCYQWGRNGEPLPGETFRTLFLGDVAGGADAILDGGYYIDTWEGDCNSTAACRNRSLYEGRTNEVAFNPHESFTAKLYPNPVATGSLVTLEVQSPRDFSDLELSILDVNGRLLSRQKITTDRMGDVQQSISVDRLSSGYYIVHIVDLASGERRHLPMIVNQ